MKTYVKTQRVVEDEKVENVFCDWCGAEMGEHSQWDGVYIIVKATTGEANYGNDGGWETGWEVEDLCVHCIDKLRRLLEDNGVKVKEIDRSW